MDDMKSTIRIRHSIPIVSYSLKTMKTVDLIHSNLKLLVIKYFNQLSRLGLIMTARSRLALNITTFIAQAHEKERSTLNLGERYEKPFSQTGGSDLFSTVNMREDYQVPRMLQGYRGTFEIYSFLNIGNEVLEVFAGDHCLVAFRMRGPHKEYGVLRYFQLPDDRINVKQVKAIKKVFYDDEQDHEDEWIFIYLLIDNKVICMVVLSDDIISQTINIQKMRIETIPLNGKPFDLEGDIKSIEEIMFRAVANIDSQMLSPNTSLNPDDYVYAVEIRSEVKTFNPFTTNPIDRSSACFSRYPYSPSQIRVAQRDDLDVTASKLESRMLESCNSWVNNPYKQRPSSALSNQTYGPKAVSCYNDGSYFQSPTNMHKAPHFHNPSIDSNINPISVTDMSYNPFEHHLRKYSQADNFDGRTEDCDRSRASINDNNKSITPEYIGEYRRMAGDQYHIEKIASPISQAPSQGRRHDLSSVTEEAIDAFEQSELATNSHKEFNKINGFEQRLQTKGSRFQELQPSLEEESDYEEEEEEDEGDESEYSESTYVSEGQYQSQQNQSYNSRYGYSGQQWNQIEASKPSESYYGSISHDNGRFSTWVRMLRLPKNSHAFQILVNKGMHPAFEYLYEKYPIDERELYERYIRILSCVGYW